MSVDMCVHMCVEMCADMCVDVCVDICVEMCIETCVAVPAMTRPQSSLVHPGHRPRGTYMHDGAETWLPLL